MNAGHLLNTEIGYAFMLAFCMDFANHESCLRLLNFEMVRDYAISAKPK